MYKEDNKNLFKSKKTTYNKRVASKIKVADWELKVVVPGMEPIRIAFDWDVENADSGLGKQHFKKFPIHVNHNSINIKTFTDKNLLLLASRPMH